MNGLLCDLLSRGSMSDHVETALRALLCWRAFNGVSNIWVDTSVFPTLDVRSWLRTHGLCYDEATTAESRRYIIVHLDDPSTSLSPA